MTLRVPEVVKNCHEQTQDPGDKLHSAGSPPTRRAIAAIVAVNRCVFWFHPLAWWLDWRLRTLAEEACDDASLAHIAPDTYARTLVDIAAALAGSAAQGPEGGLQDQEALKR